MANVNDSNTAIDIESGENTLSNEQNIQTAATPVTTAVTASTGQKSIIEATEASAIASGNNIYINQGNALKQIDYDLLADAILNKLSSKTYSSLTTLDKTILGALSELNGKSARYRSYNVEKPDIIDGLETIATWTVVLRKVGLRTASISFNINAHVNTLNSEIILFTLPEEYRPLSNIFVNYPTQEGFPALLAINSNGNVSIYLFNDSLVYSNFICRQHVMFFTSEI